jgi:hypothetical protein
VRTILFVDEVHRFNKSQQDVFLPHIEDGTITFIGATTENPSFELNNALLSRARVYLLKRLEEEDILAMIDQAMTDPRGLNDPSLTFAPGVKAALAKAVDGDGRKSLNYLELLADMAEPDGSGHKLARQAGHSIVPPQPSLCSLVSPDPACRRMMGLALRNVTLTLLCDGKPLFTEQGEALFTHFGLSGPLVLSASTYIEDITKHRYICEFDLKPALDEKTLYDRLTRDFAEQGSHSAQGALAKLLPNSMRPVAVEKWGIDPATKAAQITREQKQALVDLCKHWQVPVSALGDKEHAVITAGGVDVREVDPKTMASKLCAGLYFAGEVLDVDARTGGYNLQIAWSTAVAAAKAL